MSLSIGLPGLTRGLAAQSSDGPLFVAHFANKDLETTVLTTVELTGAVMWSRQFRKALGQPRVSDAGTLWIAHCRSKTAVLSELDVDGLVLRDVPLEHEPAERLGAFVVLPDGLCALWTPKSVSSGSGARVARYGDDGTCLWSTPTAIAQLSYPGVVEMSVATNWQVRPMKPWSPRTLEAHHWEPLLVAGHRIAATLADSSGIAMTFFLDTATGQAIANTVPGPSQRKAITGPGEFLIGSQGYGAFSTARYGASGAVVGEWPTHTIPLVDKHGAIYGPESENRLPSRSHFVALEPDGTVRCGPDLDGYYTSYPALDEHGTAVFWRHGQLQAVDPDLTRRVLLEIGDAKRGYSARMLLLDDALLAFTLQDELILSREPSLGALNTGVWPCADGGVRGNPVVYH